VPILPKERDPRLITIRRGGTLTDEHHRLLADWALLCAEHVLHLFVPQATLITHSTFCTPDPQRKFAAPGKHPDHAQIPARAHGQGAEATYSALRDVAWSVIRMSVCRSSRKSVTLG